RAARRHPAPLRPAGADPEGARRAEAVGHRPDQPRPPAPGVFPPLPRGAAEAAARKALSPPAHHEKTRAPPRKRKAASAFRFGVFFSWRPGVVARAEEHTSELQSPCKLVCRLLLEKKNAA